MQSYSGRTERTLLSFKESFLAYKRRVLAGTEGHFDKLARKLEAALAPGARENEDVVIRSSKGSQKRRAAMARRRQHAENKMDTRNNNTDIVTKLNAIVSKE